MSNVTGDSVTGVEIMASVGLVLDAAKLQRWHDLGVVTLERVLSADRVAELSSWVDQLEGLPEGPRGPLHHYEQTDAGPVIARTERFADVHDELGSFLRDDVGAVVSEVCAEPVVLFKEKVNYKYPGGGGFAPHQDARAYRFAQRHYSVMVPLDPSTEESGCLWFADNPGRELLDVDERGRIPEEVTGTLDWRPLVASPGDLVVFDSAAPHRSGINSSDRPRRAMYLTYNAASEGDFRVRYYADKDAEFSASDGTFGGDRVRISISDDFLGRPVGAGVAQAPVEHVDRTVDADAPEVTDRLIEMYSSTAAEQLYDEAVTERDHALQAASLAESEGAPPALVAAALLHDIGHLMAGDLAPLEAEVRSDAHHEGVGAAWLRPHFGSGVADPVALHVAAKRYLCAVDPAYADSLSPSSVRSLGLQGGPMSPTEAALFESNRHHEAAVRLRRWDDRAKVAAATTPDFEHFVPVLRELLTAHRPGDR